LEAGKTERRKDEKLEGLKAGKTEAGKMESLKVGKTETGRSGNREAAVDRESQ
jgi:hypothetical protein